MESNRATEQVLVDPVQRDRQSARADQPGSSLPGDGYADAGPGRHGVPGSVGDG